MQLPDGSPSIFHTWNRVWVLGSFPLVAALCLLGMRANLRAGKDWLNWLVPLVVWLILFMIALRRRLVIDQDGLEYTDVFSTIRVPWRQVTRLITRTTLGLWRADGLEGWIVSPEAKDVFIDLSQFSKSWRQDAIGATLRKMAPHLFQATR